MDSIKAGRRLVYVTGPTGGSLDDTLEDDVAGRLPTSLEVFVLLAIGDPGGAVETAKTEATGDGQSGTRC